MVYNGVIKPGIEAAKCPRMIRYRTAAPFHISAIISAPHAAPCAVCLTRPRMDISGPLGAPAQQVIKVWRQLDRGAPTLASGAATVP
jgi:hypothetical protein